MIFVVALIIDGCYVYVNSKWDAFGLGDPDQAPAASAPEPKPAESASSTLNQPVVTSGPVDSTVEVTPTVKAKGEEKAEVLAAPPGKDVVEKAQNTPSG